MSESKQTSSSRNQNKGHPKFEEGEKVLCFHGDLIYEAKCSKIDFSRSNDRVYFVHYSGWNKNWDEWVSNKRILKFNDENLKKQQELIVQSRFSAKKIKLLTQSRREDPRDLKRENSDSNSGDSKRFKQNNYSEIKEEEKKWSICTVDIYSQHNKYLTNPKLKIIIPLTLKEWLIDDLDAIMQQNKLVKVPNSHTVSDILNDYREFKLNELQEEDQKLINELNETTSGLIRYFNVMLGSQLLYKFERIQYSELLNKETEMCDLYGAIHLLRLLVKLDEIISYVPLEPTKLEVLIFYVNDILKFMDKKNSDLFKTDEYIIAPPNYIRAAF